MDNFSGSPGPERVSTRQTQGPSTTLSANQIRMRVIFAHPPDQTTLTGPLQFPTEREILVALALEPGWRNLQRAMKLTARRSSDEREGCYSHLCCNGIAGCLVSGPGRD